MPDRPDRLFARESRKWWTLAAVAIGLFMIMLDNTVVNVALPSIRRDLGISISQLEWVVNGYALTFGVLLLSGGKLADLIGRRLIFIVGLVIFTASSFFCGFAGSASKRGAGRRRGADEPGDPLDHHGHLSGAAARNGDRHLGRCLGDGTRDRPARRWCDHGADQLELGLLHQRPDRDPGHRGSVAIDRRVKGHLASAATRPAGSHFLRPGTLCTRTP
jgi:hypothetical protein